MNPRRVENFVRMRSKLRLRGVENLRILDLANILHGFADLIHTADCEFIKYFGSDCGFCLQFSSDPGL